MKSFKWILAGLVIVGFIVMASNGFFLSLLEAKVVESSVLDASGDVEVEVTNPEDVGLSVLVDNQLVSLRYSTQAEVYRFSLDAEAPYSLRYMTFQVDWAGLQGATIDHPSTWRLYAVLDGEVDYLNQVGVGEELRDGLLKMRLSSARSAAYQGVAGEAAFALTTSVLKDSLSEDAAWISVFMPAEGWAWVPGFYGGAWLALEDYYGSEFVSGLPSEAVEKR